MLLTECICQNVKCQKHFFMPTSHVNAGRGKFCGHPCYAASMENRIAQLCQRQGCMQSFLVKPCDAQRGTKKYCSPACRVIARYMPLHERFWQHVTPGLAHECWPWEGSTNHHGYGVLKDGKKTIRAHRIAYELSYGPIPHDLHVLHNCPDGDNPSCVNPAHLWVGTQTENTADRDRKGRWVDHWNMKKVPLEAIGRP